MPIVHTKKPPARVKARKLPPACGPFVTAQHPSRIAALRMRSEVIKDDPLPIRQTIMGGMRKATAEEIAECLSFVSHDDPMMAKIAAERLLEHLQCCGFALMS